VSSGEFEVNSLACGGKRVRGFLAKLVPNSGLVFALLGEILHCVLEDAASVVVALELVEAGAGGARGRCRRVGATAEARRMALSRVSALDDLGGTL